LEEHKSTKSDKELRHLREEVVSLRGNLKKQTEENASARNQQKIKKKLAEQVNYKYFFRKFSWFYSS
jgi:hypothetical protein